MSETDKENTERDNMLRALRALNTLETRLQQVEGAQKEPIGIVGMGCRFPGGAHNPDLYWDLLMRGHITTGPVPEGRWEPVDASLTKLIKSGEIPYRNGNFITDPSPTLFDADFFNIMSLEAQSLDPQQRLLLEVTWEALEYGGFSADALSGSNTGVFVGLSTHDYEFSTFENLKSSNTFHGPGTTASIASGRISYFFNFHGPTFTIDAACSSALVALHQACRSLRNRECDLAIVGGVNVLYSPLTTISLSKIGMLSPDGQCKAFSAEADGYGRGEGCGVIVIKRLSDAIQDNDPVLALIRGTAVNHTGHTIGLAAPKSPSQQEVILNALAQSHITADDVAYLEAHGTGTPLGDAIELDTIAEIFGTRQHHNPLRFGSVKANIGHLEAASGMASIIKIVLMLQKGWIPAHVSTGERNPIINWDELPIRLVPEPEPWQADKQPRYAGVNSFGFSGTNAHIILESVDVAERAQASGKELPAHIFVVSAKNKSALSELGRKYLAFIKQHPHQFADAAYTTNLGHSHFSERIALVADSYDAAVTGLLAYSAQETITIDDLDSHITLIQKKVLTADSPQIAFMFSGDFDTVSSVLLGKAFYQALPVYKNFVQKMDAAFQKLTQTSLTSLMDMPLEPGLNTIQELNAEHPGFHNAVAFAITTALVKFLIYLGIKPMSVCGYGLGAVIAAHTSGLITFETGLYLALKTQTKAHEAAGDSDRYTAFHTPQIPLIQLDNGTVIDESINFTNFEKYLDAFPTALDSALRTMIELEVNTLFQFGVDTQLSRNTSFESDFLWLTLRPMATTQEYIHAFCALIGRLYVNNSTINWSALYEGNHKHYSKLHLPTYPFQRKEYRLDRTGNIKNIENDFRTLPYKKVKGEQLSLSALEPINKQTFLKSSGEQQEACVASVLSFALAKILDLKPEEIDFNLSVFELGVSSLMSLSLTQTISEYVGMPINPLELYGKDNVNEVVRTLTPLIGRYFQNINNLHYLPIASDTSISGAEPYTQFNAVPRLTSSPDQNGGEIPKYVFILSAPRAGSTLLRVMLDQHPQLFSPPELNLLMFSTMTDYVETFTPIGWVDNLAQAVMKAHDTGINQAREFIQKWSFDGMPTSDVYPILRAWSDKTVVDKSPLYAYNLPTMLKIRKMMPHVKVIYLTRHPYSAIISLIKTRLVSKFSTGLGLDRDWDDYKQAEQQWSTLNGNIMDLCSLLDQENWMHIRYEELVTKPDVEMRRLCLFLNLPFHQSVLHPYEGKHATDPLPDRWATGGDSKFNTYTEIDASKGEEWRYIQLPHQLGTIARTVASKLGYELPHEQDSESASSLVAPKSRMAHLNPPRRHWQIKNEHKSYDHPQKSITGGILRILRKTLRLVSPWISYQSGLRAIAFLARNPLWNFAFRKHLQPAWSVLEYISGNAPDIALKHAWTAHYLGYMLDWVMLKRPDLYNSPQHIVVSGVEFIKNAWKEGNGVILVGHHCQPLRLWTDFVRYIVRHLGISHVQAIGGLREALANPLLEAHGKSYSEQEILVQQLANSIDVLKKGGLVYIDGDEVKGTHPPMQLPCLGKNVQFMTGFAEISLLTSAPVIPMTAAYTAEGHIQLQFLPRLALPQAEMAHSEQIRLLLAPYVNILETQWRTHPENIPLHICRHIVE